MSTLGIIAILLGIIVGSILGTAVAAILYFIVEYFRKPHV